MSCFFIRCWLFTKILFVTKPIIEVVCAINIIVYRISSSSTLATITIFGEIERLESFYSFLIDLFSRGKMLIRIGLTAIP